VILVRVLSSMFSKIMLKNIRIFCKTLEFFENEHSEGKKEEKHSALKTLYLKKAIRSDNQIFKFESKKH